MKHYCIAMMLGCAIFGYTLSTDTLSVILYDQGSPANAMELYAYTGANLDGPDSISVPGIGQCARAYVNGLFYNTLEFAAGNYYARFTWNAGADSAQNAAMLIAVAAITAAQADTPWNMLPADNTITGITATRPAIKIQDPGSLYGTIDGGAMIYDERGFVRGVHAEYQAVTGVAVEKWGRNQQNSPCLAIQPNPVQHCTTIGYWSGRAPGNSMIAIFTTQGKLVASFLAAKNTGTVVWNGYNNNGCRMAHGTYIAHLKSNNAIIASARITLID